MATWNERVGESAPDVACSIASPTPSRLHPGGPLDDAESLKTSLPASGEENRRYEGNPSPRTEHLLSKASDTEKGATGKGPMQDNQGEAFPTIPLAHRRSRSEAPGFRNNSSSSPVRRARNYSTGISNGNLEDVDLGGAKKTTPNGSRSNRTSGLFSSLFQGESSPIKLGYSSVLGSETKDIEDRRGGRSSEMYRPPTKLAPSPSPSPSPSPTRSYRRMNIPSPLKQVASTNPLSFFSSKTQAEQQREDLPELAEDQFLNLDINAALFPSSLLSLPTHEAFAELQHRAEHLVREFQSVYKLRTFALHEALAEKSSRKDELDEAQSRVQNVKSQLNGMAARVVEQDKAIAALTDELNLEKQQRETRSREQSEECAKCSEAQRRQDTLQPNPSLQKNHTKQSSGATINSDSGFESGDESIAESVFSRETDDGSSSNARHSTVSMSTINSSSSPTTLSVPTSKPTTPKAQHNSPRQSAYERVMKGISSSGIGSSFNAFTSSMTKCPNCRGGSPSDAWEIVNILREENRGLKRRMAELEDAVEECITLAGG